MIEIRQAVLADKEAIFKFLAKAYQEMAQYKFPERWVWQFEKNPFRQGDKLPVWIAVNDEGEVVGQICAVFEPLKMGAGIYRSSCWAVDIIVLPEYREHKLGTKLFKAIYDDNDILIALQMSAASRHLLTKLGFIPVDAVTVFSRIARFDPRSTLTALENRLDTNFGKKLLPALRFIQADRVITVLINAGVGIKDLWLSRYLAADIVINQIDEFDDEADQFWNSVSAQFHTIIQRDSQYLNWKYIRQPHIKYQLFTASRSGKMCGYIILRKTSFPETNSGIIADLFAPLEDKATIFSLLAFAVQYFKQQKVKYIDAASTVSAYKNALLALGFRKKKDVTPLFHSKDETLAIESAAKPDTWFLGRSDHDWDQFPYA